MNTIPESNTMAVTARQGSNGIRIAAYIIAVVVLVGCSVYAYISIKNGTASAYQDAVESAATAAYDSIYNTAYEAAEEAHHVSNEVVITIEDVQQISKLEVLQVSNTAYITPEDDEADILQSIVNKVAGFFIADTITWLKVPGTAVFTVDLSAAEFIVDSERNYVLIRIPNPEISEFTIDYASVEMLYFKDGGLLKDKTAKVGVEKAREYLQDAELELRSDITGNQRFYQSARNAAETILTNLVKEFNADVEDLTVVIEFIE